METLFEISYFYSCVYLSKVSLNKHSEKNPNDILFFYLNCKKNNNNNKHAGGGGGRGAVLNIAHAQLHTGDGCRNGGLVNQGITEPNLTGQITIIIPISELLCRNTSYSDSNSRYQRRLVRYWSGLTPSH